MTDSDLIELANKFVKTRLIQATPTTTSQVPISHKLGEVKGCSQVIDDHICLNFTSIRFSGYRGAKSILFEEGRVIDFSNVDKQRNDC